MMDCSRRVKAYENSGAIQDMITNHSSMSSLRLVWQQLHKTVRRNSPYTTHSPLYSRKFEEPAVAGEGFNEGLDICGLGLPVLLVVGIRVFQDLGMRARGLGLGLLFRDLGVQDVGLKLGNLGFGVRKVRPVTAESTPNPKSFGKYGHAWLRKGKTIKLS